MTARRRGFPRRHHGRVPRPGGRVPRPGGFTLIEMLVVVVIVGILASTVALGFLGSDREQNLRTEAERLAELIEMARSEAVQRNEEWGLAIGTTGYRFLVLDSITHRWVEQKSGPFHPRETPDMKLTVQVDALTLPGTDAKETTPEIIMFSSGEQTPFEIEITPQWKSIPWSVKSDGLARASVQRRA